MKIIEYAPEGTPVPDVYAEELARVFLTGVSEKVVVSTENFVLAARVHVMDGVIPHAEVLFVFGAHAMVPDADGRLVRWPVGFCDVSDKLLSRLMAGRVKSKG